MTITPPDSVAGDKASPTASRAYQPTRPIEWGVAESPHYYSQADNQADNPADNQARGVAQPVRRQITILFCDVVDYTSRSLAVDPEELSEQIRIFQKLCGHIAASHQGYVSHYLGDGILVLFGYPHAREFAAKQAVTAGLEMVAAIKRNNTSPEWQARATMQVRIGIATGLVVVDERSGQLRNQGELVFGQAPNLAARLQGLAAPNTVVTSSLTRLMAGSGFKFRDLDNHLLKGFDQACKVWQVLGSRNYQSGSTRLVGRTAAAFSGRAVELKLLLEKYHQAARGQTQFVHLTGEAGIGKSRLVRAFERRVRTPNLYRARLSCSPYFRNSPFKPIVDEAFRWLGLEQLDVPARQARIDTALTAINITAPQARALFYQLMAVPRPAAAESSAPTALSNEEKYRLTIEGLVKLVRQLASIFPLLLVVEDLHWADASTLKVLNLLVDSVRTAPIFGVLVARPEFTPSWSQRAKVVNLPLTRLTHSESEQLVESVFGNRDLPQSIKQTLVYKSAGVPLFIEESSRAALNYLEHKADDPLQTSFAVPETLQDSLNAHLDQLGQHKAFAQLAATFSADFSHAAVDRIAAQNGIDAAGGIAALLQAGLIQPIADRKQVCYEFRHILFQEAAYQSLLLKVRQRYHQQIADLLHKSDVAMVEQHPQLLAHHYNKTRRVDMAVKLWLSAGRAAINKSAMVEARDHLQRGLALVDTAPDKEFRARYKLALLLDLGVVLTAKSGYFGQEVGHTYARAAQLSTQQGSDEQKWVAWYGRWRYLISQAHFAKAIKMLVMIKKLSDRVADSKLLLTAYGIQGLTRMVAGRFAMAERYYAKSVALYTEIEAPHIGVRLGQDPYVTIQGFSAINRLLLGQAESHQHSAAALKVARRAGHPYTIAETLRIAAIYAQIARQMRHLKSFVDETKTLSQQYGFDGLLVASNLLAGFNNVVAQRDPAHIKTIEQNLRHYEHSCGLLFLPYFHALLAEAQLLLGDAQAAFRTANQALDLVDQYGEVWVKSIILGYKAEAAARGNLASPEQVAAWYDAALAVAERQHARLFWHRILRSGVNYASARDAAEMRAKLKAVAATPRLAGLDEYVF